MGSEMCIRDRTVAGRGEMTDSVLERDFLLACRMLDLPEPEQQYKFHPTRRWKADFAWVAEKLLVEVEGGEHVRGRHVRGKGYNDDCVKYNSATIRGYRLLRFTGSMVANDPGGCAEQVREALKREAT